LRTYQVEKCKGNLYRYTAGDGDDDDDERDVSLGGMLAKALVGGAGGKGKSSSSSASAAPGAPSEVGLHKLKSVDP
jgi:hypothetical protein